MPLHNLYLLEEVCSAICALEDRPSHSALSGRLFSVDKGDNRNVGQCAGEDDLT